jgi:predicted aspartyl protease
MNPRAAIGRLEARYALALAFAVLSVGFDSIPAGTRAPDPPLSEPVTSPTSPTEVVPDDAITKPDYEAPTRPDRIGRIIVPVMLNGRGPFQFALDTGANRTVLAPQLVAALGLDITNEETVIMNGATGSAVVPTVVVERVAAGDVVLVGQRLPVADALTSDIDGILGVDGLESKRIMVDFINDKIEIRNARHERPISGALRISAQLRFGRLIVVDAYVDRIRVKAVIDTGSESTLGNGALYAALYRPKRANVPNPAIDVLGETLASQRGELLPVAALTVGDVQVNHFNVVFGKFYIFKLWNLDRQPAIVIGMDLIGRLDTLVIDYERQEVQLRARAQRDQLLPR